MDTIIRFPNQRSISQTIRNRSDLAKFILLYELSSSRGNKDLPKLLLIEGLPQYERVNEEELIHMTLQILKKDCDKRIGRHVTTVYHEPKTKYEFLELLEEDCRYLHISAHGEKDKEDKGVIYVRSHGTVTAEDIISLDIRAEVIFANACEAYNKDLLNAFLVAGRPKKRVYIAPKNEVDFGEAYLIALLFWKRLILDPDFIFPASQIWENQFHELNTYK